MGSYKILNPKEGKKSRGKEVKTDGANRKQIAIW